MDEQKFREWMGVIQNVLEVFVAAKENDWQTFVDELNKFDKSLISECLSHRSSKPKSNEKVNGVRVDVLKRLSEWNINIREAKEIFEKSKKEYNYENRKLFWVLYPIYYYKYDNLIKVFLDNLEKLLLDDLWIDWLKSWGNDFNWWQNQWTDKVYVWFFNGTHPSWESAIQFRIQSKWSDKLIVWLFENKNFISGKYVEFDIATVTYKNILDQFNKYKDDILSDIFTWDKIPSILDYIKNNVSKYWYITDKAESQRKKFLDKYPLNWLKDLQISKYCYQRKWTWDGNNFTNLLVPNWTCSVVVWELIEKSENFLFYKNNDWSFVAANVMNDYKERAWDNVYDMFDLFISDTYNFVNNFNVDNYNPSDYIQWATYLKSAILFFYKWDILINLWQNYIAQSIANKLWFNDQTDAIWYDILISNYLKDNIPEIVDKFWFYSIWRCLNNYYKTYLKSSKNISVDYYAVWAFLWDIDEKQEFYNREKLIVGRQELWNLKDYNDDELVKKFEDLWYNDTLTHFKQTFKDFKKIKKWDIVCLKSVNRKSKEMYIYAVWIVQWWYDDNYEFLPWLWHSLPVKWKILDEKCTLYWAKYQKTLSKINDDEIKKMLDRLLNEWPNLSSNQNQMIDLNTILYWVPWTWKTYNTINYAVAIIENKPLKDILDESHSNREAIRKRYENYVDSWQIVFTTFHQSFWYEDFIEGIKAEVEEWWISYKIKDWIFKELCLKISKWEWKNSDNFDESRNKLVDELNEKDTIDIPFLSWKWSFKVELNEYWTWLASRTYDENWEWIRWHSKFFNYDQLYNIYKWLPWVPAWWHDNYRKAVVNEMKKRFWLNEYQENLFSDSKKNYVLIIDEINRWNISKIFWELITLLEPDKRLWWKEELKVKLPYSQDEFWVPNNLFVLWTMNTADRSIALIDLALRRRFKFREIEPNSDLLDNINVTWIDIKKMFETINDRIELLYDRDHLLWHAYFLPLKGDSSLEKLNSIMLDNIIPLLQEYFHDDWEKIQMILGDHDNQNFKNDSDKIIQKNKNFNNEKVLWFTDEEFEWDSFVINKKNLNVNSYLWIYNK